MLRRRLRMKHTVLSSHGTVLSQQTALKQIQPFSDRLHRVRRERAWNQFLTASTMLATKVTTKNEKTEGGKQNYKTKPAINN